MKLFRYILESLLLGIVVLVALIVIGSFVLRWLWDYDAVNSARSASVLLRSYGDKEHRVVIAECSKFLERKTDMRLSHEFLPDSLKALAVESVRVVEGNCEVSLYAVPGKSIGYVVGKGINGSLELSWRNQFESWQHYIIQRAP